jgi:predicted nucleic acid-binding protein
MLLFLDTNVFLYAIGGEHPLREPCRTILRRLGDGDLAATTSTEVVQELLYVLARRGRREQAVELAGHVLSLFPDLLPVRRQEMEVACELVAGDPELPPRDAVHAATMLNHGLVTLVSADPHFDRVPGLERLTPDGVAR